MATLPRPNGSWAFIERGSIGSSSGSKTRRLNVSQVFPPRHLNHFVVEVSSRSSRKKPSKLQVLCSHHRLAQRWLMAAQNNEPQFEPKGTSDGKCAIRSRSQMLNREKTSCIRRYVGCPCRGHEFDARAT